MSLSELNIINQLEGHSKLVVFNFSLAEIDTASTLKLEKKEVIEETLRG